MKNRIFYSRNYHIMWQLNLDFTALPPNLAADVQLNAKMALKSLLALEYFSALHCFNPVWFPESLPCRHNRLRQQSAIHSAETEPLRPSEMQPQIANFITKTQNGRGTHAPRPRLSAPNRSPALPPAHHFAMVTVAARRG